MTPSSQPNNVNTLLDKQDNGLFIEQMVNEQNMTYLQATTHWLEENSINFNQYAKYIPDAIIEKLTQESLANNEFRPSFARTHKPSELDFL